MRSKSGDAIFFNKIAIAIHAVLGISNLIGFQVFFDTGMRPMGVVTTAAHFTLLLLNTFAVCRTNKARTINKIRN